MIGYFAFSIFLPYKAGMTSGYFQVVHPGQITFFGLAGFLSDENNLDKETGMGFSIKPQAVENIIVILFEMSFIALAIHAKNIEDIPRMKIAITAFFMTIIPYIAEKLLRISFPLGVKAMIPFALFMHTAGGIMRWYWEFSGIYYDKIAHMIGGIALGLVIFVSILTVILFTSWDIKTEICLNPDGTDYVPLRHILGV